MPAPRNVLLITNPVAGQARGKRVAARLGHRLEQRGLRVEIRHTTGAADAPAWAVSAGDEGFDLVVAVGGDGTVQEVIDGLIRTDAPVPLAHLPVGTANVIALALGLPWSTRLAADLIVAGRRQRFDVGRLPDLDRTFFLMAAAGYPARLLQDSPRRLKNLFGVLTYAAAAWRHLLRRDRSRLRLSYDDDEVRHATAGTVLVANIGRIHNLPLHLDPATSAHDGLLDVSVISSRSAWQLLQVLARLLAWRRRPTRSLMRFSCRRLLIEADPPLPVQVDGEIVGATPLLLEVRPAAVEFVVGGYRPPALPSS